jgi:hypothetical protein
VDKEIIVLSGLVVLGVLQACMQGLLFYNSLSFIDKKLLFGIKWFSANTSNKDVWHITLFGKPAFIFKWFPFIMFVDFFHFCHGCFGLLIGLLASVEYEIQSDFIRIIIFAASSLAYSVAFDLQLKIMKKIKNGN